MGGLQTFKQYAIGEEGHFPFREREGTPRNSKEGNVTEGIEGQTVISKCIDSTDRHFERSENNFTEAKIK